MGERIRRENRKKRRGVKEKRRDIDDIRENNEIEETREKEIKKGLPSSLWAEEVPEEK